jgi:DNA helicase HerA-like ATPase
MVQIGTLAASENLPATVDLDKIVTRHAAIVGSTGSGKSNTVAGFLKALVNGSFPSARVVVIDPHGEYGAALKDSAKVYSISSEENPFIVPYWALSFDELAWFLVDRRSAGETLQDAALRDFIFNLKSKNCATLDAGQVQIDDITVDSPIPFSLREVWYYFDRKERVTYEDMGRSKEALQTEGSASTLTSAIFKPPGAGSAAPFKPTFNLNMGSYLNKMLGRIKDKKFQFLLEPGDYDGVTMDLDDLLASWIDHDRAITVLDLGGIPFDVTDLIVGVVTRILFEGMFWGRDLPGIGRQRPVLIVYEEAHAYLPSGGAAQFITGYAGRAVRRIFKEGRKYGVGAIVVSQRPSELDETILAQCGTFFALRLSNGDDQGRIKSTVPDALGGLIDLLPALRTGEVLILGEAVKIPSRVRLPLIEPRPKSDDPEVTKRWKENRVTKPNYDFAVTSWRRQQTANAKGENENAKETS